MFGDVDFDGLKEIDNESGTLKVTFEESDERKKRKIEFCEVGCGDFYGRRCWSEQQWWMRNKRDEALKFLYRDFKSTK